jgi:hypothetical protein
MIIFISASARLQQHAQMQIFVERRSRNYFSELSKVRKQLLDLELTRGCS